MKRFDEVIRKQGSQWCLFHKSGKGKLGCHDTKEKAQKQEIAIKIWKSVV